MNNLLVEIPYVIFIAGVAVIGLWWANYFYDAGIKQWLSRKVGHFFGGVGFLLCALLFSSFIWPLILAIGFTSVLFLARLIKPESFRGVGGSGRSTKAMSEVWFPFISIPIIGIGWGIFNRPLEAVACLLMMAFGDCVTGWIRALKYDSPHKGLTGSFVMLGSCLIIAWAFLSPFWLGAIVALVATIAEFICGDVSPVKLLRWADDNWTIPLVSAITYFGILAL